MSRRQDASAAGADGRPAPAPDDALRRVMTRMQMDGERPTPVSVVQRCRELGADLVAGQLANAFLDDLDLGETVCPPAVADFVTRLLAPGPVRSVLDPWVATGGLLAPLVQIYDPERVVGVHPSAEVLEVAGYLLRGARALDLHRANDPHDALPDTARFDAVVSVLPWEPGTPANSRSAAGGPFGRLLRACRHIKPDGLGVFVVLPHLLRRGEALAEALTSQGLHLEAAFRFPHGTFGRRTAIRPYAVVLRIGAAGSRFFLGEVGHDDDALLDNFRAGRESERPELGCWADLRAFRDVDARQSEAALLREAPAGSLTARRLGELCTSIRPCRRVNGVAPESAIFLRTHGRFLATDAPPAERARSYWTQLELRLDEVDPSALLRYLDGPLGQLALAAQAAGGAIPHIDRAGLEAVLVFLPERALQQQAVEVDASLEALIARASELRQELWRHPDRVPAIRASAQPLLAEPTFTDWLDTLPYPLASVLWAYQTVQRDAARAVEMLDHFFEALAQFLALWMLAAADRCAELRPELRTAIQAAVDQQRLQRTDFGTWLRIVDLVSKKVRPELATEGPLWRHAFACDEPDLLAALTSEDMVKLLRAANDYRNRWRGHGGVPTELERVERQRRYEALLMAFRRCVGARWAEAPLVAPGTSRYRQGSFTYESKLVMGSRTPLKAFEHKASEPMDADRLHIIGQLSGTTCALPPLVRLGEAPPSTSVACYFFNRIEGKTARFVSYQMESMSEINPDDQAAVAWIAQWGAGE